VGPPTVTVTDAVPLTEPEVAVIVAVPSATEVTRPDPDTVATAASDVAHVTVALAIVAPFWSLTVAAIWDVAPKESKLRLVTERVIEVATSVGVGVGVVGVPSPPQLHNNSETNKTLNVPVCFIQTSSPGNALATYSPNRTHKTLSVGALVEAGGE
jgi:hypothetical protein